MARVRLVEVATAAGVSLATASRVLNGSARRPGREVTQKVQAAARELGYLPNASAQALARSTSGLLGLVIPDLEDPYYAAIASGFQRTASAQRRLVLVIQTGGQPSSTLAALGSLRVHQVAGVLVLGSLNLGVSEQSEFRGLLAELVEGGAGIVSIGRDLGVGGVIRPDDRAGAVALAQAAVAGGYRYFAVLEDTSRAPSAVARAEGFAAGLQAAGLDIEHRVRGSVAASSGREVAAAVVRLARARSRGAKAGSGGDESRVSTEGSLGFFAITDAIALAVLGRAQQAGIRVPEELGILGFDGITAGRDCWPGLTTVDLPLREMGRHAARMLLQPGSAERPAGWTCQGRTVIAPGRFRAGGSTLRASR